MQDLLYFNGIDAVHGGYLLPAIPPDLFARAVGNQELDPQELAELKYWLFEKKKLDYGLKEGDSKDLAQAGWGVIFPAQSDPAIKPALKELLDWRQEQAGRTQAHFYREFSGDDGYQPGESKLDWLKRHGMGPGPADPHKVPYYLLIVGDPNTIPYRFQTQIDVQYASGRLFFDTPDEYAHYAHSVVEAEKRQIALTRTATFFGVSNSDDPATTQSATDLVQPLSAAASSAHPDWSIKSVPIEETTKDRLARLLGGDETPALLFTASHGMGFPSGHPLQSPRQGALLTQDWPGPLMHSGPIPEDFYFSAEDLSDSNHVFGMLAFFFACYSAGCPQYDEFTQAVFKDVPTTIAPRPFSAALPKKLLTHPRGSALAVVGHVDRAWGSSFNWGDAKSQLGVFERMLNLLFDGHPIGDAVDPFNIRYAEISADLNVMLENISFGKKVDPRELAGMWTANNDARNYVVIGDPAVRLMTAAPGDKTVERPVMVDAGQAKAAPPAALSPQENAIQAQDQAPAAGPVELPSFTLGRLFSVALDRSYRLPQKDTILVGRGDPAGAHVPDIDLTSEGEISQAVSRQHAQITVRGQQLFIEDLNSKSFTRLNGKQLEPRQVYPLKHGDELRLGPVQLIYIAY